MQPHPDCRDSLRVLGSTTSAKSMRSGGALRAHRLRCRYTTGWVTVSVFQVAVAMLAVNFSSVVLPWPKTSLPLASLPEAMNAAGLKVKSSESHGAYLTPRTVRTRVKGMLGKCQAANGATSWPTRRTEQVRSTSRANASSVMDLRAGDTRRRTHQAKHRSWIFAIMRAQISGGRATVFAEGGDAAGDGERAKDETRRGDMLRGASSRGADVCLRATSAGLVVPPRSDRRGVACGRHQVWKGRTTQLGATVT